MICTLLQQANPEQILNIGTAGSLTTDLRHGDIFIASQFTDPAGKTFEAESEFRRKLVEDCKLRNLPVKSGNLFRSNVLVSSISLRRTIREKFQADAVDMEAFPAGLHYMVTLRKLTGNLQ